MTPRHRAIRLLGWVALFAAAFAFVEASVVVYLRALYYPEGFAFPLRSFSAAHLGVELVREGSTIIMLAAVGIIAGTRAWERLGYFLVAFGLWDIFFYLWLRIVLGWPVSLFEWDILFLLPLPWMGPVIAPVAVAFLMTVLGSLMVIRVAGGETFRPRLSSWLCAVAGTAVLLFSFMNDPDAGMRGAMPRPYRYDLLITGLLLYATGFITSCRRSRRQTTAV